MGRRLPIFCLGLLSAWVRPPRTDTETVSFQSAGHEEREGAAMGKRIMVVVDSSREAKAALQWALSHAMQSHDTIVLLEVVRPSRKHVILNGFVAGDQSENGSCELLYAMRKFCQARKPEVKVEISLVEGKERGATIVNESRRQQVSLLVLGHKKRSVTWRLLTVWSASSTRTSRGGAVKYCIHNAECMTLAVRRKSRRGGGFLITSRRHKDFWLLA